MKANPLPANWLDFAFLIFAFAVADVLGEAHLDLQPGSGPGNALISATSSGFQPLSHNPDLYPNTGFYRECIGLAATCPCCGGDGSANCTVQLRAPVGPGPHTICARTSLPESASANYEITPPTLVISKSCGTNGTRITVGGHSFDAQYYVEIDFDGAYTGVSRLTDESGNFAASLVVPSGTNGPHTITAWGNGNPAVRPSQPFTIDPNSCTGATNACKTGDGDGEVVGTVMETEGIVLKHLSDGTQCSLGPNSPIHMNDVIEAKAKGRAFILFIDNTQFTMFENTKLTVDNYVFDPDNDANNSARYSYLAGAFQYLSGLIAKKKDPDVEINTPYGTIGIRGTEFISRRDPCSTTQEVYLIEGQLAIKLTNSVVTNIVAAPATILFDANNVITNTLTRAMYDSIKGQLSQTNAVTFASWQVSYFGCTNNNPSAAPDADPDGDGQNNYAEFLAHTDPTTNASVFRLVSGAREGDGVRLVWKTHGGVTNVVQAAASVGGTYSDISSNIVMPGDADVTTNYLDPGVVTNTPARFYRIRLTQ